MVAAEGWSGCAISENNTTVKPATSIDASFHKWFLCGMQCCLIAFHQQSELFQNWSQSSQTLSFLYHLSSCDSLNPLLSFQQSSLKRFYLKKLFSLLLEATPHPLKFYQMIIVIQSHLQVLLLILALLLFPPHLHAMLETWVQSLGWEVPLEKGKATHSSILAWRIPWTG